MTVQSCPEPQALQNFSRGLCDDDQSLLIAEHLEQCTSCQQALDSLMFHSTLLGLLRDKTAVGDQDCEAAIARVLARAPGLGAAGDRVSARAGTVSEELGAIRDYQLLEKIGQGGMGAVYKAMHRRLRKLVAIKLLPPERVARPESLARFDREMQAVGALDHTNLVRALDAGDHLGQHYLVMEYIPGCDLSELVARLGPLPIADACEMVRQAAVGLQYAHQHGLVHRDVKPSNLMLCVNPAIPSTPDGPGTGHGEDPVVKILDLGLALLQRPGVSGELTDSGQCMGTVDYMAPEQGRDSHQVDLRADLYSLGATLYKLLSGRAPFASAEYSSAMSKLVALATTPPQPVRQLRPEVPAKLAELVDRLLAKSPQDRPASAAAVAAALMPFVSGHNLAGLAARASEPNSQVRPTPLSTSSFLTSSYRDTQPKSLPQVKPAMRNSSRWTTFAVVAALVALLGIIITIQNKDGTKTVIHAPGAAAVTVQATSDEPAAQRTETEQAQTTNEVVKLSPWDTLDPAKIPEAARLPWLPKETVAVIGDLRGAHFSKINSICMSPDGRFAVSMDDALGILWDAHTLRKIAELPSSGSRQVRFAPDSVHLALSQDTLPTLIYKVSPTSAAKVRELGPSWITHFLSDNQHLILGASTVDIRLVNWVTGAEVRKFDPEPEPDSKLRLGGIRTMAMTPDEQTLVASCALGYSGGWASWDVSTGAFRSKYKSPHAGYYTPVVHPLVDNDTITLIGNGGIHFHDIDSAKEKWKTRLPSSDGSGAVAISVGSKAADVAYLGRRRDSGANYLVRFEPANGMARWEADLQSISLSSRLPNCMSANSDGSQLVVANTPGYGVVRWFDGTCGKELLDSNRQLGAIHDVRFTPDGRQLATFGQDGAVRLWKVENAQPIQSKQLRVLDAHYSYCKEGWFSPDGRFLAAYGQDPDNLCIAVWQLDGAETNRIFLSKPSKPQETPAPRFLGQSRRLLHVAVATDRNDPEIQVADVEQVEKQPETWRIPGGVLRGTKVPLKPREDLATSPSGNLAVMNMRGRKIAVWDISSSTPRELVAWRPHSFPGMGGNDVHDHRVQVAFLSDTTVATLGRENTLSVEIKTLHLKTWDVSGTEPKLLDTMSCGKAEADEQAFDFSPDHKFALIWLGDGRSQLWDFPGERLIHEWNLPGCGPMKFAPDGRHAAFVSDLGNRKGPSKLFA